MKATGLVRKIDDTGSVVIPAELRRQLGFKEGNPVEIYMQDDTIVLQKIEPVCFFCGLSKDLHDFSGKKVCKECIINIFAWRDG